MISSLTRSAKSYMAIAGLLTFAFVSLFLGSQVNALHEPAHTAECVGIEAAGGTCDATVDEGSLTGLIGEVVNILSILVGALAVIMIIVGGLRYITSSGDSGRVASAKNTIIYAVIGLLVAILANVIVNYVLNLV